MLVDTTSLVKWVKEKYYYIKLLRTIISIALKEWLAPAERFKSDVTLNGKVAIVTGGNSGIGLETARDLARRGATVVIASRNEEKSETAVKNIIDTTGNENVHQKLLNLAKFSSIKEFVEDFNRHYERLDILVNNAGSAPVRPRISEDGVELLTQINYVGPFLLTNLLLDKLVASKPSRIVIVSSLANEFHDFDPDDVASLKRKSMNAKALFQTYANTKLCGILWAKALAKRLPEGVTVNAEHPGIVMTNIFNKLHKSYREYVSRIVGAFFKTAEEGADTIVYLCVDPELDGVTGEYFGDCQIVKADKLTEDDDMVERVYRDTMKLIEGK